MLTEIYIEALLVDEELADRVWERWYSGEIDEATAILMWALLAHSQFVNPDLTQRSLEQNSIVKL